jgi:hypothetical protein
LHWSREAREFVDDGVTGLKSAEDELFQMIERNLFYPLKNRKKDALFIGLYYYAIGSKEAMAAYNEIKDEGLLRVKTLIVRGNREGAWKVKSPDDTAYSVHSLLVGEIFKIIIHPKEESTRERIERCQSTILAILKN